MDERLARFYDIPIELKVELDSKPMKVRDILGIEVGSVIQMNRSAGDNMSLLFHGVLAGYAEVVIIENSVGIRITDLAPE